MELDGAIRVDLTTVSNAEWYAHIGVIGEEAGYFEPLGPKHSVFFAEEGPVLLVTFETRTAIRARPGDQLPLGHAIAKGNLWSNLTIIADEESWYRDPAIYAYFDRLVDDAFFEDFDRVVFYGAGPGGYAAAAFSAVAPGATVISLQPQATLDPRVSGWDTRYEKMRRTSFTDRYGFAPDMLEGAGEGFVIYDPNEMLDAMHAALFTRDYVTRLPCPNIGGTIEAILAEMNILEPMLVLACEGRFTASAFWQLYRARRDVRHYLRNVLARLESKNRTVLGAILCRNVVRRLNAPRWVVRLNRLEAELMAKGITLPPERPAPIPDVAALDKDTTG
ncbi:phosphoadenosine phosphosulfate reductase [Phaeovulum sp.]|uniref:phosphoadenosine phosphosulfate reductase n=1 Tax=Phaeovulum sp. TaxID=2934796 RepID=UPI0039E6B220